MSVIYIEYVLYDMIFYMYICMHYKNTYDMYMYYTIVNIHAI